MNEERWIGRTGEPIGQVQTSRREMLVGGAFLAAAAAGFAFQPHRKEKLLGNAKLDNLVPEQIGAWRFEAASGLVLPPQDQLRDQIYSQLLTRVYVRDDGASVMLLIAYSGSQDGVLQVHRPEVCYPASGYRLSALTPHQVPVAPGVTLPSRYIVAEADTRREQLIYWTRLGEYFPTRWSEQKTAVIAENLAGIIPDGVLVRISSVTPGDGKPLFDAFARDLYRSVGPQMRQVLVGATLSASAAGTGKS